MTLTGSDPNCSLGSSAARCRVRPSAIRRDGRCRVGVLSPVEGEYPRSVGVSAQVMPVLFFVSATGVYAPELGVDSGGSAGVLPPACAREYCLGLSVDGVFKPVPDECARSLLADHSTVTGVSMI